MNVNDARVRFTRQMIEETFLSLLREKPVSNITVTELCARAGINRATFYKHYMDVPDLLDKLEQQFIEKVCGALGNTAKVKPFLIELLTYLREDGRRYMILASDHGDRLFPSKIFTAVFERTYPLFKRNVPGASEWWERMTYDFLAYGSGAILSSWMRDGMKDAPEGVAELMMSLCTGALEGIRGGDRYGKYK